MASASIEDAPVSAQAANLVTAMKMFAVRAATTALVPPPALPVAILPDGHRPVAIRRRPPSPRSAAARHRQSQLTSAAPMPAARNTWPAWPSVAATTAGGSHTRRTALPARLSGANGACARSTQPKQDLRLGALGAQ